MNSNEDFTDVNEDNDLKDRLIESRSKSLRNQIAALEHEIETNIKMKHQLELELSKETNPRRKAELHQSIAGLAQILDNHINESLSKKNELENQLSHPEYLQHQVDLDGINLEQSILKSNPNQNRELSESAKTIQGSQRVAEETENGGIPVVQRELSSTIQPEQEPQSRRSPKDHVGRSQTFKKAIVPILIGVATVASVGGYWYSDVSSKCNQELQPTGSQQKDQLQVQKILAACQTVFNLQPNNVDAWKNAGRTLLLTWPQATNEQEKMHIISQAKDYFRNAAEKSHSKDPQSLFYKNFMEDFKEFVLQEKDTCLTSATNRYRESLDLYNKASYRVLESDQFILLELSHFLIHRDGDSQGAIDLLDNALKNDPDPNHQNKFHKNILITKAKAETYLGKYLEAKNSLKEALKYDEQSYKIMQDLASVHAQIALDKSLDKASKTENRKEAIAIYKKITETLASNVYIAWRNKAFLLYLDGNYSGAANSFRQALSFRKALNEFDKVNRNLVRNYSDLAEACKAGDCSENNKVALQEELKNRRIFSNNFITHDLIENEITDPFFSIEHDKFYKCQKHLWTTN